MCLVPERRQVIGAVTYRHAEAEKPLLSGGSRHVISSLAAIDFESPAVVRGSVSSGRESILHRHDYHHGISLADDFAFNVGTDEVSGRHGRAGAMFLGVRPTAGPAIRGGQPSRSMRARNNRLH